VGAAEHIAVVNGFYAAFGRGDVATILDGLADDVDWAADTNSTAAPWYGVRHGKDQVAAFFTEFGTAMEVQEFTPLAVTGDDTSVLAVVRFLAAARGTGKTAAMNLHHYFRFRDGLVVYYRGSEDTAQTEAVLR